MLLLADPQVYTRALVWHDVKCVVEILSMTDGLSGKPNGGSCTIEFQQGFRHVAEGKILIMRGF